jgi:hypothetical protein
MPKFEVTTVTAISFEAESADEARYLVENGETPRDHELVAVFISTIEEIK